MPDNAAQNANQPESTDNVAQNPFLRRSKWADEKVITSLYLNEKVLKSARRMAVIEGCSVSMIVEEALATWLKWMAKAALEDLKSDENRDVLRAEYEASRSQWKTVRASQARWRAKKRRESKHQRGVENRRSWAQSYPGKPWPGAPGVKK